MKSYTEKFSVKSYETDLKKRMRPFAFMNHAQNAAEKHADMLNFGYDNLIKESAVWVLSRFAVKFISSPDWKDEVNFETWHKGTDRLFGIRDFKMTSANGEVLALATSLWLIINADTRKILRVDKVLGEDYPGTDKRDALSENAEKLTMPAEAELCRTITVSYSDIDINEHTNNAKYVEWANDCVDIEILNQYHVKEMTINFNSESRIGEKIDLYRHTERDEKGLTVFVEGKRGETSVFAVRFIF